MKTIRSSMIILLLSFLVATQLSVVTSLQPDYDFFLFVLRWPGAECSGVKCCCFSTTGKPPAAFGIHGLWPQYKNTTMYPNPTKCDPNKTHPFNLTEINNLKTSLESNWLSLACPSGPSSKIWEHEWVKHGTCSLSTLKTQYEYFEAALNLKAKKNLLQILKETQIEPNGSSYKFGTVLQALTDGIGFNPGMACNKEKSNNTLQLYEVSFCVDKSGSNIIECPVTQPVKTCESKDKQIKFLKFGIKPLMADIYL